MFKILLILLLVYLVFRAGRNLLRAAVKDGLVSSEDMGAGPRASERGGSREGQRARRSNGPIEIEDAVWEDLP